MPYSQVTLAVALPACAVAALVLAWILAARWRSQRRPSLQTPRLASPVPAPGAPLDSNSEPAAPHFLIYVLVITAVLAGAAWLAWILLLVMVMLDPPALM